MVRATTIIFIFYATDAFAHHLDAYDEKLRQEMNLPSSWFTCKTSENCELVYVPCQSDMAVNKNHSDELSKAIIKRYPFCFGTDVHDTEAICDHGQCMTMPKK